MPTSPHYATDLLARAAALLPSAVIITGTTRNAWHSRERPSDGGETPASAFFAQEVGGFFQPDTDGELAQSAVQVLTRGTSYGEAFARAKAVHDALHLSGRFTANAHTFLDVRSEGTGPVHVDFEEGTGHEWFSETFVLWYSA